MRSQEFLLFFGRKFRERFSRCISKGCADPDDVAERIDRLIDSAREVVAINNLIVDREVERLRASADLSGTTPRLGVANRLFTIPFRGYDMRFHFVAMPGGTRFLVNAPPEAMPPASATVILNAPIP